MSKLVNQEKRMTSNGFKLINERLLKKNGLTLIFD